MSEASTVEVPKEWSAHLEWLDKLTLLEASSLVKHLEEKWGVSAAAPAAVMMAGPGGGGGGEEAAEKSSFDVILVSAGSSKIPVIKLVKEITGQGLKESKELVDGAPKPIKTGVPAEEAEALKTKLEEAGATVELK